MSDAPTAAPRRFRALVAYEGGRFHGWQAQASEATVQGAIEEAIRRTTAVSLRIEGAGRTDAGVHALGQVATFVLATSLAPERLRMALNAHLPPDVRVHVLEEAPEEFSARGSACWRRYQYLLTPQASPFLRGRALVPRTWPDAARLRAACPALIGEKDFRAFTTQPEGPFGCLLHEARWEERGPHLLFVVTGNRFLYQMVRILVGTFLEIGRGRREPDAMARILAGGDRRAAGPLAPACGLYLSAVGYDPPWPAAREGSAGVAEESREPAGSDLREPSGEGAPQRPRVLRETLLLPGPPDPPDPPPGTWKRWSGPAGGTEFPSRQTDTAQG